MSDYSTNLTEKQWQVINNIVKSQEKSRKTSLREIINAIFHLIKSGCQWRMLPTDFAPGKQFIIIFASRNRKECGRSCRMFFISWQGNQSVNRKVPAWYHRSQKYVDRGRRVAAAVEAVGIFIGHRLVVEASGSVRHIERTQESKD